MCSTVRQPREGTGSPGRDCPPSLIPSLGEWNTSRSHPVLTLPAASRQENIPAASLRCWERELGSWTVERKGRVWISVRDDQMRHWECFPLSGSFGGMSAGIAVRNFPVISAPKFLRYEKTSCPLFPAFSTKTFLLFFPLINKPEFEQSL